jgi:ribosomal protein L32E
MQAADFFAWEMRKSCEERKGFVPSYVAEGNLDVWRQEHDAWESNFKAANKREPRMRKSAFRLMTEIKNSGIVFDYRNLTDLKRFHPNGWET